MNEGVDKLENQIYTKAKQAYNFSHKYMKSEYGYKFTEEDYKTAIRKNLGID